MSGEGFTMESFEKHEVKTEEVPVVKTETVATKPAVTEKKETVIKGESASLQTQVKKPK